MTTVSENGKTYEVVSVDGDTATLADGSTLKLSDNLKAELEAATPSTTERIKRFIDSNT